MLKKKVVIPILLLFIGMTSMFAQNDNHQGEKGKKAREIKKAYLTEELNLTEAEGEKFWPLYDNYINQKKENNKKIKAIRKSIKENENISEGDFRKATDDISDLKIKAIDNNKSFINDCIPILGVHRTIQMIEAEKNFRKKMREKRQMQR